MFNLPLSIRSIPNTLTLFRLVLIIPFLYSLYIGTYAQALYLFLLAGLSDGLDGWMARYFKWQTPLGSFIDPLADKLLVVSSFIALALLGALSWWLVILVFLRDLTISLGVIAWYWFIRWQLDFKPTMLSKINTSLQLILVTICLFQQANFIYLPLLINTLTLITAITTTASYIDYVLTWSKKAYIQDMKGR